MRKPWLFILLCAIAIRRSCSTPIDDYNNALVEQKLADEAQINATIVRESASAVLKNAMKELEDAEKELKSLTDELVKKNEIVKDKETTKLAKEKEKGVKETEYNTAKAAYEGVEASWKTLDNAANAAHVLYKPKKEELDKMDAEGSALSLAQKAEKEAAGKLADAQKELVQLETAKTKADQALTNAKNAQDKNEKLIADYKKYETLKIDHDKFKKSKEDFTKDLATSTNDKSLESKKKIVEKNLVLKGSVRVPFLSAMTFKEALDFCKKTQLPTSTASAEEKQRCKDAITYLERLQPYYEKANVKESVDGYAKMKKDVDEEIKLKLLDESYLQGNATAAGADQKKAETGMKDLVKQNGNDFEKFKNAASEANKNKKTIDDAYDEAKKKQIACDGEVTKKKTEIGTLTITYNNANTALTPLQGARNTLAGQVIQLETDWKTERGKADDNKRDFVDPAKGIMDKKFEEYDDAVTNSVDAANNVINANQDIPQLKQNLAAATTLVQTKKLVIKPAEEADAKAKEDERVALLAIKAADTNVREKKEAKEKYEKAEAENQVFIKNLKIGLGAALGILFLVVIGGVLGVFFYKRKKKREEEEAKGPEKTKTRQECGLILAKIEGDSCDKFQMEGDDIKVRDMATTFPRWHNYDHETMNWKHTFDGPEGEGVKSVRKIFFDMNQVEAIPTGPAHDFIEGGDSITRSETSKKVKKSGKMVEETAKDEPVKNDQRKESSSNPQSSDEKQSGSKSNRANTPGSTNPPPSSPSGEEKKNQ